MDFSPHNIQRITEWIQLEVDYNFLNLGYTIAFNDDQVLLDQNDKELKQVCPHCLLVSRYLLFFKCGQLTCLSCFREYWRHRFMFEKNGSLSNLQSILPSIDIKWRRTNFRTLFQWECLKKYRLFALTQDVESYPLEKIHHHEMFECPYQSILCPAQGCQFINNVETVIFRSINCPFHLLYCAICKSLYNVSVLTQNCNVIKSQRTIPSVFKYYHNISRPNHSH